MHSPLKPLLIVVYLITALGAINIGLTALGHDFFELPFVMERLHQLIMPLKYIIGVSGVISLVMLLLPHHCSDNGCKC